MYAVVQTGGKQVKLTPGDVVRVESLDAPVGDTVELGEVKLMAGESGLVVDPKQLASAKVVCEVTAHGRGKKIRVFKYKRRKNYSRLRGHRQNYTQLKVKDIVA
jgi:large subunit ribosomal protein L21